MNIYEMLDFIRKNDNSDGRAFTHTADFLMKQHANGALDSEDLFNMYRELMITMVTCLSYLATVSKGVDYNV